MHGYFTSNDFNEQAGRNALALMARVRKALSHLPSIYLLAFLVTTRRHTREEVSFRTDEEHTGLFIFIDNLLTTR
jgi:hypothetical protein